MTKSEKRLRVIPLGGLDGIGKNMTVIEYGPDLIVVDAGLMFPDDAHPGIDLILPDYRYILDNADKLRGIIITHGHEDHTGALPYLLKDLDRPVPVLGTKLTLGLIKNKLEEHKIKRAKLREVKSGGHANLGGFSIDFFAVNHSIPDGVGLFIRTAVGSILHTGDFKLDQTPIDGRLTDYAALTKFGKAGVTLLMSDSTGAESKGITRSEAEVGKALREVIARADQRVIVASFASHIHRIQQVCDAAVAADRKVIVTGRSMVNNTKVARELGYLDIDADDIVDAFDDHKLPPEKVVIMCTGSQGEPLSALARMANADHKTIKIEKGDTVILAASPVPGNEKAVSRVINRLSRAGCEVVHKGNADVHVSGHASAEELKLMMNLTKPEFVMPIHGETRHLVAHSKIAQAVGIEEENVFVMDNGDVLEIDAEYADLGERVRSGVVYVDGVTVGDVGQVILRDRQHMGQDGFVSVVVAIDVQTGKVAGEPQIVTRGIVMEDGTDIMTEVHSRLAKTLARTGKEGVTDSAVVKRAIRESISQLLWERTRSRPMIVPVVMEV